MYIHLYNINNILRLYILGSLEHQQ